MSSRDMLAIMSLNWRIESSVPPPRCSAIRKVLHGRGEVAPSDGHVVAVVPLVHVDDEMRPIIDSRHPSILAEILSTSAGHRGLAARSTLPYPVNGFTQRTFGNRAKSVSAEWTIPPYSTANAAR